MFITKSQSAIFEMIGQTLVKTYRKSGRPSQSKSMLIYALKSRLGILFINISNILFTHADITQLPTHKSSNNTHPSAKPVSLASKQYFRIRNHYDFIKSRKKNFQFCQELTCSCFGQPQLFQNLFANTAKHTVPSFKNQPDGKLLARKNLNHVNRSQE